MCEGSATRNNSLTGKSLKNIPAIAGVVFTPDRARFLRQGERMKWIVCVCAAALLTGCATEDFEDDDVYMGRGAPPAEGGFDTGTIEDEELPYRQGPGVNMNSREWPRRSGPGGLGTP
jgi:hypothetical protein